MKLLGDTRGDCILSLELVGLVCSLVVVIPAFAAWATTHETLGWLRRRLRGS